jgi:hypothetical protein
MVGKMLHGTNGVASFLRQHCIPLRQMWSIFNPPSRQSVELGEA